MAAALEGAVADEKDGAFGEFGGETVRAHDHGLRPGLLPAVRAEDGGIDLHPAGIHHRNDGMAAFRDYAQPVRLAHEDVQGSGGKEGKTGAEAEPFRRGNAHAESRVGSRSPADAYGIQIFDSQAFLV